MKINFTNLLLFVVFILTSIQISAQTTYEIIDIGQGGVSDISKNGEFVCGMNYPAPAYIWSQGRGRIELTVGEFSEAYGVSNNGKVVGRFYDPTLPAPSGNPTLRAGYWEIGSWNALEGLDGLVPLDELSFTHAYGISADGTTIVGMQWHPNWSVEAVRWVNGNAEGLGQTFGENSRANVVSSDGSIVAGWNAGQAGIPDREAYYWDPTPHFLGGFDQSYLVGECGGISSDGSIIVGTSVWPFIWTAATGMKHVVADSSDYDQGYSLGVSDDGTIVGWVDPVSGGFDYQAFIKKPNWPDIVYLSSYINDSLGITGYSDYYFAFGQAISADGKVIGMTAYTPLGEARALLLRVNEPVPVELISFTASANNSIVNLNWSTATELNNSGFEIQRKNAKSEWVSIGFIKGLGTTTTQNNYSYTDQNPIVGNNVYRLKQVDYDGTFDYSQEVEVELILSEYVLQQNYPNPFNPATTINFNIPQEDFVNVTIFNSLGEKVATLLDGVISAGTHSLTFNANSFASGLYILKMSSGSYSNTIKMNLMK
jgi:uncharacterized membrane protein